MDPRVKRESVASVETLALLVLKGVLVREDLLATEDSPVLMVCQDQRVPKVIVEFLAHMDQKVPLVT